MRLMARNIPFIRFNTAQQPHWQRLEHGLLQGKTMNTSLPLEDII